MRSTELFVEHELSKTCSLLRQMLRWNESHPVRNSRCKLCPNINPATAITGPNGKTYNIQGSFNCDSANIIYAITCNKCPTAVYIGQTGQSLRKRMNNHKFDIQSGSIYKPIGEHFNRLQHSMQDLRVAVLKKGNYKNSREREIEELKMITNFDCVNTGLNRDYGFMSHYK